MKKLKISMALLAVAVGFGTAVSTTAAPHRVNATYGYNQDSSQWELVKAGYSCDISSNNCTAQFNTPPGQGGQPIPGTLVNGDFTNGN